MKRSSAKNLRDLLIVAANKTAYERKMIENNKTEMVSLPAYILLPSVVFKFIAMIIGVLGNITVLIYTIFLSTETTTTSYLVGNLAQADLLVCLTFYPVWIIEFIHTMLSIDSNQDLFCRLSRSTIFSLLFASVATLLAITVDRYLYIVKPLKYPMIVTKRRVVLAISGIWLTACCLFIDTQIHERIRRFGFGLRSLCYTSQNMFLLTNIVVTYAPLTFIFILNFRILNVARKQRQRISAETTVKVDSSVEQSANSTTGICNFYHALKGAKTFSIVVAVLVLCCFIPTLIGATLYRSCSLSCIQMWFVAFHYELYGINSIVNVFIYGMRHVRYTG